MENGFENLQDALGRSVKLARISAGLSQEALANSARMERSQVSNIERGAANPSLKTLHQLAGALGTDVASLLSGNSGLMGILLKE